MTTKIAINGFGRIGRSVARLALNNDDVELVAINDLADPEHQKLLFKRDSVHGTYPGEVSISDGVLSIGETVVNELPPRERGVGKVFQSYALYPHMTVYENMAFGLNLAKADARSIEERVMDAARILQLDQLLDRLPKQLSGGQRQRVAIGRAITRKPKVFLFDEPLSNLDAALRVQMRIEIAKLHHSLNATMIYVTHDQVEAMTLADRIAVLRDGYLM